MGFARLSPSYGLGLLMLLWPALALAQGTVQQSGPVVKQHLAMYIGNARIVDAGGSTGPGMPPANQANPGTLPTGLGVVATGLGYAAFNGYANAPYNELLWGFDKDTGDGLIKLDRVGGGPAPSLFCEINGVRTPCFGGGSGTLTSVGAEHGLYATPNPVTSIGVVGCLTAAVGTLGCVKPDGTTITITGDGVISTSAGATSCAGLSDAGTACQADTGTSGHTLPFLDADNDFSAGVQSFGTVDGKGRVVPDATYTFAAADCGKPIFFTSNTPVIATIPQSIVPVFPKTCSFAVVQDGNGKVTVNGTAVAAATLVSPDGFTATSGDVGAQIGLLLANPRGTANAYLSGNGS